MKVTHLLPVAYNTVLPDLPSSQTMQDSTSATLENHTDKQQCQKRVILFASKSGKAAVLENLLVNQCKITCLTFDPSQMGLCGELVNEFDLVIFDHADIYNDDILDFIAPLTTKGKLTKFALLGIALNSDVEDILKWPTLKGMFHPNASLAHILKGVDEMLNEGYWLPRAVLHKMIDLYRLEPFLNVADVKLTKREKQILEKLNEGASNQAIADQLYLSTHTVKRHLYNIFKKAGTKNRIQTSNWAKERLSQEERRDEAF